MQKLSTPYQIMIIIITVFAVYYPTIFAEICLVDDYGAMTYFFSEDIFSLKEIFLPHSAGGGYYRPLIAISYILDKEIWFLHQRLMHFESVVAHLVNVVLVFYICREAVYLHLKRRETRLPIVAALIFALHPIATESVNWISGRTDIMMGTFVLISVQCVLRNIQNRSKLLLAGAIVSGLIACLAKETAFGYLIGLPLLMLYKVDNSTGLGVNGSIKMVRLYLLYFTCAFFTALLGGSYWLVLGITLVYLVHIACNKFELEHLKISVGKVVLWVAVFTSALAAVIGMFIFLRRLVFTSSVSKIGQTVTLMMADLDYTISLFLGAVGFYVRKFFIPLPLNFFIKEIDPLYDFAGIAVLLVVCHLILSKKLPALLSLLGILLLLPALPFAFGTIAWTAYAERYIYLSSAFWIMALCLWCGQWLEKNFLHERLVSLLVVVFCLSFAGATFWRNIIWQSNVSLMRNTVAQTPNMRKLRNLYIRALLDKGDTGEALKQYHLAAVEVPSFVGDEQAALWLGGKLVSEHRYKEALEIYEDGNQRTQFKSESLLTASIKHLNVMLLEDNPSVPERVRLAELFKKYSVVLEGIKKKKPIHHPE